MKPPCHPGSATTLAANPVFADPSDHAPAHGYYKKDHQARHYQGKSGVVYVRDHGISSGLCIVTKSVRSSAA